MPKISSFARRRVVARRRIYHERYRGVTILYYFSTLWYSKRRAHMKNADTSFMMLCEICHIKVQTYNHALIQCTIFAF